MKVISLVTVFLSTASANNDIFRHLQATAASTNPCTEAPGSLTSIVAFSSSSFTGDQCKCNFVNELENAEIDQEALGEPGPENPDFWGNVLNVVNDLLRKLNYQYSNKCNACQCIGTACGIITANEEIAVEGSSDANLTLTDVFALLPALQAATQTEATGDELVEAGTNNVTALALLFGPNLFTKNVIDYCMEFNDESAFDGKVCLGVNSQIDGEVVTTFSTKPQNCTLTYNDQSCASCQFEARDGVTCASADCSAVAGIGRKFDTCTGEGLGGVLQFLDKDAAPSACGSGAANGNAKDVPDAPATSGAADAPATSGAAGVSYAAAVGAAMFAAFW